MSVRPRILKTFVKSPTEPLRCNLGFIRVVVVKLCKKAPAHVAEFRRNPRTRRRTFKDSAQISGELDEGSAKFFRVSEKKLPNCAKKDETMQFRNAIVDLGVRPIIGMGAAHAIEEIGERFFFLGSIVFLAH